MLSAGTTLGPYEIIRVLGAGGMGQVYLARDRRLDRQVALKLLPPDFTADPDRRARFEREARLAAALQHPHICTIHEMGESNGQPFIAMEYVEGTTLQARGAAGEIPVDTVIGLGVQIADALDEAHRHQIVHRDLKTANVVVTPRGDVKILDFGIAKRLDEVERADAPTLPRLSQTGVVLGTMAYMSPEQAIGQAADHRSDLFSFGVVLYELLTGRLPFTGATSVALANAILHETPAAIPRFNASVPDPLVRIVAKLLEKNRDERYQSARDVCNDLRRLQRESGATPGVAPDAAGPPRRAILLAVAVGLAIVLGAIAWWWRARAHTVMDSAPSIVVLPAEISGPQSTSQYDYLRDAVPATLSTRLASIDGLETKVPPTNFEWESAKRDVQTIVHAYEVKYYLSPHVYTEPNRLAMTIQLVQSDTRKMVWSHDYDGTADGYQSLIGQAADDLRQVLRPASAKSAARTTTSEAELAYQEGHYGWDRFNNEGRPEDATRAEAALKRALTLDPTMADAAAELAFLYEFRFEHGAAVAEMRPLMEQWAREALRIDPHCGLALTALADAELLKPVPDMSLMVHNALKGAFYAPRRPITHNLLGVAIGPASTTLSAEAMRYASKLDPLYRAVLNNLAGLLFRMNRSAEAVTLVDEALARGVAPSLAGSKIDALIDLGRLEEVRLLRPPRPPGLATLSIGAQVHDYLFLEARGDPTALPFLQEVLLRLEASDLTNYAFRGPAQRLLPFLGKHGRTDAGFRLLSAGIAHDWRPSYDELQTDARLETLRRDPRFDPFLRVAKARMDALLAVLEETRQNGELPGYLVQPLQEVRTKLNGHP